MRTFLPALALVGDPLDAFLDDLFQKGQACAVVVRMHLRVEHTLFGLVQLHAQLVQCALRLLLGRGGVVQGPVCNPPQHGEALLFVRCQPTGVETGCRDPHAMIGSDRLLKYSLSKSQRLLEGVGPLVAKKKHGPFG
jgi:hypothetical protein